MRAPIGLRLRNRRKSLGISQAALARRIGISASYLNLIEANKRDVGGALLQKIAAALGLDVGELSGEREQRLIQTLEEALADPLFAQTGMSPAHARDLVAQQPLAARALTQLYAAHLELAQSYETLAHRLRADPLFAQLLHQILNHVTALRSSSEILNEVDDLEPEQKHSFVHIIGREARAISDVSETLIAQFDETSDTRRLTTPAREVDDLIMANGNHFAALEDEAGRLSARLSEKGWIKRRALEDALLQEFGVTTAEQETAPNEAGQYGFEARRRVMWFHPATPSATRRFQLARLYAELVSADVIEAQLAKARLSSRAARALAFRALASYLAGATLLPYRPFLAAAQTARYDVDRLAHQFAASFEQAAHRIVTLKRPGDEGLPFGFLRSDPAGRLTKHFPLPGLLLPSTGHACPLWAIYAAFSQPGRLVRQIVRFPDGGRYLFVAKTVSKRATQYHQPPPVSSVLLATNVLHADQTVYAQGLALDEPGADLPVGPACRLCTRRGCAHRQEEALDLTGIETGLRAPLVPRAFAQPQTGPAPQAKKAERLPDPGKKD